MKKVFVKAVAAAVMATSFLGCQTSHERAVRTPASVTAEEFTTDTSPVPAPELGEVWGPANVDQANKIVNLFASMLKNETKPGQIMRRDAHPKHHACVQSTLHIDPAMLPPVERVGLYAQPATYDAWVRFPMPSIRRCQPRS